ncbi:Calx-beta domain-containing protein [Luteolibacter luteus]|uniref:PKD domain-containing protein n=1 Tax=Luteolibacter luteus TaxID=2728835 RepID=A0A858RRH9_9BACT|nr:Calx-beta domain-containing protein [Luteolibacter luteus]QJE98939.1 PKD domain-containing protein [Luteolibacter luteus]
MSLTRRLLALCTCLLLSITVLGLWPRKEERAAATDAKSAVRNVRHERAEGEAAGLSAGAGDSAPVATADEVAAKPVGTEAVEKSAGFGQWVGETIPEPDFGKIAAFKNWTKEWKEASPETREAIKQEGIRLAAARRPEFKALIAKAPQTALEEAVPRVIRQDLPEEIVAELEKPVSATGDYNVYMGRPEEGTEMPEDGLTLRYFHVASDDPANEDGYVDYKARVFGGMLPVMSKKDIPLRGVAMDREFAVAESPVRQLESGERIPAGTVVEETCPVSGETTEAVASDEPVTEETPTIEVGERVITLCNGSHVTVVDEQYRTLVQASGPGGPAFFMDAFPGTSSRAIGNFRCLYIRATYPDQMAPPNTEDQAIADMRNTTRYYLESSYGKMTTTATVTPLIVLPQTLAWYIAKDSEVDGLGTMQSQARAEARKLGYDPSQYNCIIVRVNGGLRSGASWGGGDSVWLGWGGMDVINHECGHSLGRSHANYWQTDDGTPYGNGQNQEYGNSFDVMGGGGGYGAHYNTISKRALGWLPDSYVHLPKGNGVFRLYAYDQPQLEEGKRYALSVAKDSIRGYNIEYHPAKVQDQALVIYSGMGSNAGHLLDTTPGSSGGKNDGGIQIGRTYSDPESDQHFTVISKNDTTPSSLDIAYFRGPFPGNQAPTLSLAASATTIAAGGTVTFTATAADADGDALAYRWEFDDGSTADNAAVITKTFAAASQITAMLTVSDMKGGTARRHVVINVGSHGRQTVTGNITWNGQPLKDVRVSDGSKYAMTDSSGNYALSGLTTGSKTLTATLNGFTFSPSFTNPLNVVAGTNTANWTAGNSNFVTLAKIADPVEGGANGSFALTRTGDVTNALTVRVSPVGGTATKTTDYTFSPDHATDGSYRSFTIPAGQSSLTVTVAAVNDSSAEGPETITLQLASNGSYLSQSMNSMVMTIGDNDTSLPMVSVRATTPYAKEFPAEQGQFTFYRTGSTTGPLSLSVAWSGTATNGSDCTTLPTSVSFSAGEITKVVNVSPLNDSLIEGPEEIIATINNSAAYLRDSAATSATVTLSDDDTPVVTVSVADASASEAGPDAGMFLLTRTGSTAAPLKVYYGLSGSAFHGTDYAPLTGETTIPAGATSAPVVITPYNDDLGEPTEDVTLAVTTFNNSYSIGTKYQATLNIADNSDTPLVSVRAGATGTEGGSAGTFIFRAIGSTAGNITVNYTVSGTATRGSDYTALPGTVSIPANGTNEVTVNLTVLNDSLPEPTETVKLKITPGAAYRVYNDGTAEAAIRDNDSGGERVAVSAYNSSAAEGGSSGKFYISRTGTSGALTVNYLLGGTATNGVDYTGLSGSVEIPDGSLGAVVTFTPVNDSLAEGTEKVTLSIVPGATYGVDRPDSAILEIADNETMPLTVGFQNSTTPTSEQPGANGEFRDIPVVLSASSANTVTVDYVAGAGSSAAGDDVDWAFVDAGAGNAIIPGGTLTFAPGTTTQNIRIRVKNDGVAEQAETAVIELRAAYQAGLTSGLNKNSVLIFDGPTPTLVTEERWNNGAVYTNNTFNSVTPNYTGLLTSFTTALDVADNYSRRLTGQIVAPATGQYRFWIASDDASRLYLSTTSSAANKVQIANLSTYTDFQNWDANGSQQSALINLVAGQSYYMEVQHQEGGGGDHASVAWSGPGFSRTPITFVSDVAPRSVRFLMANSTRREGDGTEPMLMAVLDRPAGASGASVTYSVSGTATAGSDYQLSPGTLNFASGEQVKLLPFTILADGLAENPEAVVVTITGATGAALQSPTTHTIMLLDAAAPAVDTVFASASSSSMTGTIVGTATATPAPGRSIASWSIVAGNTNGIFAINATGQVTLAVPASLPNPGAVQLVVRATDNLGASGDGVVNVVCNPPANKVVERRWAGEDAFWNENWSGAPNFTGTLANFVTGQNVADTYSRRLTGLLKPTATGEYTFWVAGDDDCRLYLGTDASSASKEEIAWVDGYTNFKAWDAQGSQKSAAIQLQAGKVYWLEAQQREGGGGDHLAVAWSGPQIARQDLPAGVLFPFVAAADFGAPPAVPTVNISSPLAAATFQAGSNITISADLAGGSQAITSVQFFRGATLIDSDSSAPYSVTWTGAVAGTHALTARVNYSGGAVSSSPASITVENTDPSADPDGDGFPTGLETLLGSDPDSNASQPPASYANLRAWWKLDDGSGTNADDSTGRLQDGTVSGASWVGGLSGNALDFDGSDDGLLVGTSAAVTGSGDFSLAAWVKVDPGSPLGTVIQQREPGASGHQGEYVLNVNANGTVNFFVYNNDQHQFDLTTTATLNDGQWHHVAAIRSGTAGRIFLDGVEAASGSGAIQPLLPRAVAVGYDHRDNNKHFDGSIDDVRIYERALSSAEIDSLHDALVPNRTPAFTTNPFTKAGATEDSAYSGSIATDATDPDAGDALSFTKQGGPAWLNVAANGALSGTPLNAHVGLNNFTVRVTDAGGLWEEASFTIVVANVNDAPVIASDPVHGADATEDAAYSGSIAGVASDDDAGDTISYSKQSGPDWLSVAANGTLGGTPGNGDVGTNTFTIRASDGSGAYDEASLVIMVTNVNDAPVFTADPIHGTNATEDTAYNANLAGAAGDVDADDTITYSKHEGPAWLNVAADGAITGTPANGDVGTNSFSLRVTDAAGAYDETTLLVTVINVNDAPVFTVDPIQRASATEEQAYTGQSIAETAADADAGDAITYSKTGGPEWLLVAANGTLSGSPPAGSTGTNSFTVRVTDTAGLWDEATLAIEVAGDELPLPWTTDGIGGGTTEGSASYGAGVFTVTGAGTLTGRNDAMNFAWQPVSGNGEIIARISSLENTGMNSRVGVMIRDTLATNSRHVFMGLTGDGAYRWVRRTGFNGNTSSSPSGTATLPNAWVRLVRSGNVITAYKSVNGTAWTQVGSLTADFPATCYFGLAVASGGEEILNTSQFSNVQISP